MKVFSVQENIEIRIQATEIATPDKAGLAMTPFIELCTSNV
jgi:hypothetical protein